MFISVHVPEEVRGVSGLQKLELQEVMSFLMWVLGIKLGPFLQSLKSTLYY